MHIYFTCLVSYTNTAFYGSPPRVSDPAVHDLGGPIELSPDSSPLEEPWSPSPLSSLGSRGSSYRYSPVSPLSVVSSLSPPSSPGYTSSHQRYARNDTYTHNRHYYSSDDEPMHDPSDEEPPQHMPSPQPSPPTRLRSPVQSMHTSPIQSPSRPSASRKSPTFSSRKKNSSPTPAVAASPQGPPRIRRRVQQVKSIAEIPEPDGFTCPVCKRPQANKRLPDLRRHIKTHFQVVKEEETGPAWICCGVPVAHAAEYGITDTSKAFRWAYDGEMMIRGCLQIFSRRDTYRRHLKDSAKNHPGVHCVGDPNADWVPGNKIASGTS